MRHHQPDQYKYYGSPRRRKEKGAGRVLEGKMAQNFPNWGKEMDIQIEAADDIILMAESEEELKSLLMKVKEEHEKAGLKFNILFKKTKFMASSPITSWQTHGETMETVTNFVFLDSKITADSDCSRKIKRLLLLGRKAMTNLDSMLKSRDITLLAKVHIYKAMVFSAIM